MPEMPEKNYLLEALIASGTVPQLAVVELRQGEVLAEPLGKMNRVYFPYSGIISFLVPLKDGQLLQTGMVGRDGAIGALLALDDKVSPNMIVVQLPGRAAVIDADRISEIAQKSPSVRSLLVRHDQFFLAEVQQSAACNAVHTIRQRICRWMLRMNDLIGVNVPITQELFSEMIGVRRTSVTAAAASLQDAGVIRYRRGRIQIVDIEALRQSSCECYEAVRDHYDRIVKTVAEN
jgi:CRP-like cAMP-binding protein